MVYGGSRYAHVPDLLHLDIEPNALTRMHLRSKTMNVRTWLSRTLFLLFIVPAAADTRATQSGTRHVHEPETLRTLQQSSVVLGACCRPNGICEDNLTEADCLCLSGTWTQDVACQDLNPPCQPGSNPIDPFTYLESTYDFENFVQDPNFPKRVITGADAFNNGEDVAILWNDGSLRFYDQYALDITSPDLFLPVEVGATGVSEMPSSYPGPIMVSDNSNLYFYDFDGNELDVWSVNSMDIIDVTYDKERDRILVATTMGIYLRNTDGSLTELSGIDNHDGIESIDMESIPLTYDMLQTSSSFQKFDLLGDIQVFSPFTTDLGQGADIHGIAHTENRTIIAIQNGYVVYPKLEFQNHLEPTASIGACCLADGTCVAGISDCSCAGAGGVFQGDGTSCTPGLCPGSGACCAANGVCMDGFSVAACSSMEGLFFGIGTVCSQVSCEPFGACCRTDGSCLAFESAGGCAEQSGFYQGDGVNCGDVDCTSLGACCLPSGTCADDLASESCAARFGQFQGVGSDCGSVTCEPFAPIPATGDWGMVCLALVTMAGGTIILRRRTSVAG